MLTIQLRFDDAASAYEEAFQSAPDGFDVNFAYAHFHQQLTHNAVAASVRALFGNRKEEGNAAALASALNDRATLDRDQDRLGEARQAYEEALGLRRELARNNPETYLPYVASSLNKLGLLYSYQSRSDDARPPHEEALKVYRDWPG